MMFNFIKNFFKAKQINAATAWQQAGNDAGSAYWFYAMPVHLVLQRDTFSLAEPAPLILQTNEANALTVALNKHFNADGIQFYWQQNSWYLSVNINPNITTFAPHLALNKHIDDFLPIGEGAAKWASFINEVQMLLFEHPINQAREANKLPAVNSIWCFGGGKKAVD